MKKQRILILAEQYLPGVKGGGPIRSLENMINALADDFEFFILTSNCDLNDHNPYEGITYDHWLKKDNYTICYIDVVKASWFKIIHLINEVKCDILYLNSFFNIKFSLVPIILNKLRLTKVKRIVIAPRGQFFKKALSYKNKRKSLFIILAKLSRLYEDVVWQAASINERLAIIANFKMVDPYVVSDIGISKSKNGYDHPIIKTKATLKLLYLSRIHPHKNLVAIIEALRFVTGSVYFTIAGPIEDETYWIKCQNLIKKLPINVSVSFVGIIQHEEVIKLIKQHHFFILMTHGESYGHVIREAIYANRPLIISDQTQWHIIEITSSGFIVNLNHHDKLVETLQHCIDMGDNEYQKLNVNVTNLNNELMNNDKTIIAYKKMFEGNMD